MPPFFCLLPRHRWPHTLFPMTPLTTLDGRYVIVRGRLWRTTNPRLSKPERERLVHALMDARRAVKAAKANVNEKALAAARRAVEARRGAWANVARCGGPMGRGTGTGTW
ncbi:hypothetical protein XACLE20_1790005 [Xanthomonas citri pv. citri]|nr:hypothetical protein XACLE20_1790005 [Xanthomonas citri pv. citri]CEH60881.1 hypothetical protein XACLE3_9030005 [Xanthomonas citri pv. citri]